MAIDNITKAIMPILKKHRVRKAGLFGSCLSDEQAENSDIDILVELAAPISLLEFVGIKLALEDKLNKKVDLVEYRALKPRLKQQILAQEIRLYG